MQMEAFLTEAIKSTQEERHLAVNLETAKWELADAEKELKWLKSAFASSEKEYEQIQHERDDLQNDLENDRWCFFPFWSGVHLNHNGLFQNLWLCLCIIQLPLSQFLSLGHRRQR
jgi:hypothetical protein